MNLRSAYIGLMLLLIVASISSAQQDTDQATVTLEVQSYAAIEQVGDSQLLFYYPHVRGGLIGVEMLFNTAANCAYTLYPTPTFSPGDEPPGTWHFSIDDDHNGLPHGFEFGGSPPYNGSLKLYGVGVGCLIPGNHQSPYTLVITPN